MNLSDIPLPTKYPTDHAWLNAISLILGQTLNSYMAKTLHSQYWHRMLTSLLNWHESLPDWCDPFSRAEALPGENFPRIFMLSDCHGMELRGISVSKTCIDQRLASTRHYYIVALYLLGHAASALDFAELKMAEPIAEAETKQDFLEWLEEHTVGRRTTGDHSSPKPLHQDHWLACTKDDYGVGGQLANRAA
ncbi:hypothetical protein N0V85_005834 [Neurospora sp. IMI 360204]|nr:hypothetical protein N0V85_005834 [Neurospora sp. IMI 360204]